MGISWRCWSHVVIVICIGIMGVSWRCWSHVVIVLLVQLHLCQALTCFLLLVLHIHLPPLAASPPHLLGLSQPSLPGTLVCWDRRCYHNLPFFSYWLSILWFPR